MPRQSYTIKEKKAILDEVSSRLQNESLHSIADSLQLQRSQIRRWFKTAEKSDFNKLRESAKSVHKGRKSILEKEEEKILFFIYENRQCGIAINTQIVINKASQLCSDFRSKSQDAKYSCVRRFLKRNQFTIRVSTHEAQTSPLEVRKEAETFLEYIRPILRVPNAQNSFILNMDQTPIFFSMSPKRTIDIRGTYYK